MNALEAKGIGSFRERVIRSVEHRREVGKAKMGVSWKTALNPPLSSYSC